MMKNPVHPGEIIRKDIIAEFRLTVERAANILGVSRQNLSRVINCHGAVTPEMALRLQKAFNLDAETTLRMQLAYDLAQVRKNEKSITESVRPYTPECHAA